MDWKSVSFRLISLVSVSLATLLLLQPASCKDYEFNIKFNDFLNRDVSKITTVDINPEENEF